MFKRTSVSRAAMLAVSSVGLVAVAPVQAQDAQRIEITGSAIKRVDVEGALPVTTITRLRVESCPTSKSVTVLFRLKKRELRKLSVKATKATSGIAN